MIHHCVDCFLAGFVENKWAWRSGVCKTQIQTYFLLRVCTNFYLFILFFLQVSEWKGFIWNPDNLVLLLWHTESWSSHNAFLYLSYTGEEQFVTGLKCEKPMVLVLRTLLSYLENTGTGMCEPYISLPKFSLRSGRWRPPHLGTGT